jgi:hypothetical protein
MKYKIKHNSGDITINITNKNIDKHIVVDGIVVSRKCGDCNRLKNVNDFGTRNLNGALSIRTKCKQCTKVRLLISRSFVAFSKGSSTEKIIGTSYNNFLEWLDSGDLNHNDKGIHIDHIIPQSIGETKEDMILLNNYTNLQLMTAEDNLEKGNRFILASQLEKSLSNSLNSERLLELVSNSKIIILED